MSSRDAQREQLSALMDGELSREESLFLLKRMEHDAELRDEWERLHLVSAAQHGEYRLPSEGFCTRVMAAVAAESTIEQRVAVGRGGAPRWLSTVAGGAVAAAVAYVALVNLAPVPSSPSAPAVASTPANPGSAATGTMNLPSQLFAPAAQTSGGPALPVLAPANLKLDAYLLRHSDALKTQVPRGFGPMVDPAVYSVSFGDQRQ